MANITQRRKGLNREEQELTFTEIVKGLMPPPYTVIPHNFYKYGKRLSWQARECYQLLCYHRNKDGHIFPSWKTLADEANMSRNDVWDGLTELTYFNWIK